MPRDFVRKIAILTIAIVGLTLLNNHISHASLARTAIVVSLAIDYDEQFVVTAQTVMSGGQSDSTGGSNRYVGVVGKGVSMADCIHSIRSQCGVNPGFRHTSLVLFGMSLIEGGYQDYCAEFLFKNDLIPDDISIVVTRSFLASEVLNGAAPLTDISGFHIARSQNGFAPTLGVSHTDLRRYVANVYSPNTANLLPIVDISEPTSVIGANAQEQQNLYSIQTALVCRGDTDLICDSAMTNAVVFATTRLNEGWYETISEDRIIDYRIDYSRGDVSVKDEITALIKLDLQVVLLDIRQGDSSTLALSAYTSEDRSTLRDSIGSAIRDAYRECAAQGLDVYGLYDRFLASEGADWSLAEDSEYLSKLNLDVEIDIKVK